MRMRVYCKNCDTETNSGTILAINDDGDCELCRAAGTAELVPEYETPEQYEMRTGKKWPDNGAVWFKHRDGKPFFDSGIWGVCRYLTSKETGDKVIICAHTPEPPPDEWEPSEG